MRAISWVITNRSLERALETCGLSVLSSDDSTFHWRLRPRSFGDSGSNSDVKTAIIDPVSHRRELSCSILPNTSFQRTLTRGGFGPLNSDR